jgi:hypothetical protein
MKSEAAIFSFSVWTFGSAGLAEKVDVDGFDAEPKRLPESAGVAGFSTGFSAGLSLSAELPPPGWL